MFPFAASGKMKLLFINGYGPSGSYLATAASTSQKLSKKYQVALRGKEFFYMHIVPSSLVGSAATEKSHQPNEITLMEYESKDKIYLAVNLIHWLVLQFRIPNYQPSLVFYDFLIHEKFTEFTDNFQT